jgi:BirA family transcriptional regulator, biotin operon repressor / biotin---[acetyl-CoA-carboxylase] ligase
MNDGLETLLDRLADGKSHSGPALAGHLGISRAAVWKRIEQLRMLGLTLEAHPGGYQLSKPLTWLDSQRIARRLDRPDITVECRFLVDSTNARLAEESHLQHGPRVLLAEAQSAGRGRRGRGWNSPPGSGIYLSLAWQFQSGLTGLSALSLVTGIAAARVLRESGVGSIGLKWPNDLVVAGRKLGGCLIDISGSAEGPCDAIIGLGINVDIGEQPDIDQPFTDLFRLGLSVNRSDLAADLVESLVAAVEQFDRTGFSDFASEWSELDALAGHPVSVHHQHGNRLTGLAAGVDQQGRLLVDTEQGRIALGSGEISVRAA